MNSGAGPCRDETERRDFDEGDDTTHNSSATATSSSPYHVDTVDEIADSGSKGNNSLHDLFLRFEAFNFDGDQQFQSGLSKISSISNSTGKAEKSISNCTKAAKHTGDLLKFLKIKAFYYSKNIEPLDFAAYMEWNQNQSTEPKSETPQQNSHCCPEQNENCSASTPQHQSNSTTSSGLSDVFEPTESSSCKPASCETGPASSDRTSGSVQFQAEEESQSDSDCNRELSFAEVAELIQSGKPIPGISQVEVLPTNEAPTPSQLPRAKKPWEE